MDGDIELEGEWGLGIEKKIFYLENEIFINSEERFIFMVKYIFSSPTQKKK